MAQGTVQLGFTGNGTGGSAAYVSEGSVRMMYEALGDDVEAYWYEGVDAPHIPVPLSFMEESAVAWFRWKLLGDREA